MNPKVSIIIAFHNDEKYLNDSLKCIVNQTYSNLEIICVDDGSTDNSESIVKNAQENDSRIILIQQKNLYAGIARNNGFKAATGEYVMFLDADDMFEPNLVEKMIDSIRKFDAEIAVCRSDCFNDEEKCFYQAGIALDENLIPGTDYFSMEDIPEKAFQITAGHAWDKMYLASFLRENNLIFYNTRIAQDAYFTYPAFLMARRIVPVKEKLVHYRRGYQDSSWSKREKHWNDIFEMLIGMKAQLVTRGLYEKYEHSFINVAAGYICTLPFGGVAKKEIFTDICRKLKEINDSEIRFTEYPESYYYDPVNLYLIKYMLDHEDMDVFLKLAESIEKRHVDILKTVIKLDHVKKQKAYWLPTNTLPEGSRIAVYGYGDVGKDYCRQLARDKYLVFAGAYDKNYEKYATSVDYIKSVEDIKNTDFDYIVIAIVNEEIEKKVKKFIIDSGVPEDKILWFGPEEGI